jgi:ankyrin repeat protein
VSEPSPLTLDTAGRVEMLIASALSDDVRRARAVLSADPELAAHDMACACVSGEPEAVRALLAETPALAGRETGPYERAPILYACFSRLLRGMPERAAGIREVVRILLDAGADPNASFMHGDWLQVPLYGAAGIASDAELTAMLLAAGADPNDQGEIHTVGEALYHASEFADPACARLLIDAGTKQHVIDHCLGRALNFPNAAMAEMFCAHGAHPRSDHLHQAVMRRRPATTVRVLLDAGAPVDEPDEDGVTPLRQAIRWGLDDVAQLLIDRGANPAAVTDADRAGSDANALDAMLDIAICQGDLPTTRRLLDAGAELDAGPHNEGPPLGQACWRGRPAIVQEFIDRGAKLTWDGSAVGATLHGSRNCQHPEGGPTMQTVEEIDRAPYAETLRILFAAGAPFPETLADGVKTVTIFAELGVEPPAGAA